MSERLLIRTEGGPCDGETRVATTDDLGQWSWPLPDLLNYDSSGWYVKVSESGAPPMPEGSRVLRGALYRWESASGGEPLDGDRDEHQGSAQGAAQHGDTPGDEAANAAPGTLPA